MKFEPWLSITIIIENCPSAVSEYLSEWYHIIRKDMKKGRDNQPLPFFILFEKEYLSCQQNFSYGILIFISFRLMMRSAHSHQSSYRIFLRHIWT